MVWKGTLIAGTAGFVVLSGGTLASATTAASPVDSSVVFHGC